jgi:adenylate cyclase
MNIEIERKFLVATKDFMKFVIHGIKIKQAYLVSDKKRTVRIRIADDKATITIKGESQHQGLSRMEWEKEIEMDDALQLLEICQDFPVEKTRYIVPSGENLKFEVDVFDGMNRGLVLAEIELPDEDTKFEKPQWLGKEVTGDVRYYNSFLSKKPFCEW